MRPVIATVAVLAAAALALALAACGSSASPSPSASTLAHGRALFRTNCSGCHSLVGHQTAHDSGGDLLDARLSHTVALQYAREMPVRRALSHAQLEAIVNYIAAIQRG